MQKEVAKQIKEDKNQDLNPNQEGDRIQNQINGNQKRFKIKLVINPRILILQIQKEGEKTKSKFISNVTNVKQFVNYMNVYFLF